MWNDKFLFFSLFLFYFLAFNNYAISNEYTNIIYIDDNRRYYSVAEFL